VTDDAEDIRDDDGPINDPLPDEPEAPGNDPVPVEEKQP
jgi:hypothetical protein